MTGSSAGKADAAHGLTPELVDARLRACALLSRAAPPLPPLVDMSARAVTARLDAAAEISALSLALAHAGRAVTEHLEGPKDGG